MYKILLITIFSSLLLSACSNTPPPPIVAQDKTVVIEGQTIVLGGQYDQRKNKLQLMVNGEVLMQGKFPPYTPTQNLKATYKEMSFAGECYFGSVLGDQGGKLGIVAGLIQATKSSTADKCEMFINNEPVDTLFF